MVQRADAEVETLTIRIPVRLQRRGGRKLILTPDGAAVPQRKPARDETLLKAIVRPPLAAADRERQREVDHDLAEPAPAARLPRTGHRRGDLMAWQLKSLGSQAKMSAVMAAYQASASARVCARTSALSPTSLTKPSTEAIFSSVAS